MQAGNAMSVAEFGLIGLCSYGAAALAFLLLAALHVTRWRAHLSGSFLLFATLTNGLWAAALALQSSTASLPPTAAFAFEVFRDGVWLFVALRLWGALRPKLPRWAYPLALGTAALVLVGGLAVGTLRELGYTGESAGRVLIPGGLALSLIGLFLSEQIYRTADSAERWRLKFLCFGLSGLFVFDLILYSVALTLNAIEPSLLLARGAVNALLVPAFAVGIARSRDAGARLFVSSRLVLYGTSLIAAGGYLLAVAFAGYYIRLFGGTWGAAIQVVFIFGTALLLVILVLSGQVRAWLRVSLAKHLLPYKYDYRTESLRLIRTITTPNGSDTLAVRALTAVAQIVQSDAGGIWIRRDASFVPCGGDLAGPDSPTVSADDPIVRFLELRAWIVDLTSPTGDFAQHGVDIPRWLLDLPKAWLVVPILHETRMVAFVVLKAPLAWQALTWEDLDLLRTAGQQIGSYIALEEAANELAQSRQFEAYNRFAAFLMHDLNNLMAQLQLVVQNAARFRDKPEFFDDVIETIGYSVKRLTRLLEQLRQGESDSGVRRLKLVEVCREAVARCAERAPRPELVANGEHAEVLARPERLVAVLENVIRNAQEATPADGRVTVEVRQDTVRAIVRISDTGTGMDAAFIRDRLFRPFDTTKGSHGMGIGAYQAREFARLSGGDVTVESRPGNGTHFTIMLPMSPAGV